MQAEPLFRLRLRRGPARHEVDVGWGSRFDGASHVFPLGPFCKKQTRASHSSTEAEIVALDKVLFKEGYPALDLWDIIFDGICGKPVEMEVFEDNQAASRVVKTGKSQELRHVHRAVSYTHLTLPTIYSV